MKEPNLPRLIIFARFPSLGKVKTRLAKDSSDKFSLELYSSMLLDTLERLGPFKNPKSLFLEGCDLCQADTYLRENLVTDAYSIQLQTGKDLGQRMLNACRESETLSNGFIFIGTDSPTLPLSLIEETSEQVSKSRIVFGPSLDGGYYLLGIPNCRQELFEDVPWGTSRVLMSSISKIESEEYRILDHWYDVDSYKDVLHLADDLRQEFPGFPQRTAHFLQSEGLL